jgi:serine/threonine protein kinase
MEYCVTSLSSLITSLTKPLTQMQLKKIIKSIAEGINTLHSNNIIHRDIKPSNILIDERGNIKLGDFGSSRIFNSETRCLTPLVGTKWYKAPEMLFGLKGYNESVDIWSFGCLIAELVLFEPLFPGGTDFEMVSHIVDLLGFSKEDEQMFMPKIELVFKTVDVKNHFNKIFDYVDIQLIDLLGKMIVMNYNKRINIAEILKHPFLENESIYMKSILPI